MFLNSYSIHLMRRKVKGCFLIHKHTFDEEKGKGMFFNS